MLQKSSKGVLTFQFLPNYNQIRVLSKKNSNCFYVLPGDQELGIFPPKESFISLRTGLQVSESVEKTNVWFGLPLKLWRER